MRRMRLLRMWRLLLPLLLSLPVWWRVLLLLLLLHVRCMGGLSMRLSVCMRLHVRW